MHCALAAAQLFIKSTLTVSIKGQYTNYIKISLINSPIQNINWLLIKILS